MNLSATPISATLKFTPYVYKQPRTVILSVNDFQAETLKLEPGKFESQSLPVTLVPGNNVIAFTSPEPPLPQITPPRMANKFRLECTV